MTKRPHESDVEFIKALAELLRENDLTEIEVSRDYGEDDALNVRVARQIAQAPAAPQIHAVAAPASAPHPAAASAAAAQPAPDPADDPDIVPSPMVGTVYLQPEPDSTPFVKIGDAVVEGQTILIIEAMKTMNQNPGAAGRSGEAHPGRGRLAGGIRRPADHPGMTGAASWRVRCSRRS